MCYPRGIEPTNFDLALCICAQYSDYRDESDNKDLNRIKKWAYYYILLVRLSRQNSTLLSKTVTENTIVMVTNKHLIQNFFNKIHNQALN